MGDSPDLFSLMRVRFTGLADERESLLKRVAEIDEQMAAAAKALGIDVENLGAHFVQPAPMRLPRSRVDGRRSGSMLEYAHEVLAQAPNGLSRDELRDAILKSEAFGDGLKRNPNNLYNIVSRGVHRRELVIANDRIYLASKVPADPPDGRNISLFDPSRRGSGNG